MGFPFFGTTNLNEGYRPDDDIVSLEYPETPDLPRLRMDRRARIDDFPQVVLRAIKFYQDQVLKKAKATWVPVLVGYPQTKVQDSSLPESRTVLDVKSLNDYYWLQPLADVVTYSLKSQTHMGTNRAFGNEKARAASLQETFRPASSPGMLYEVWTEQFDNLVQFDCWSSTDRGADHLAGWFQYFMRYMSGSMLRQGFQRILFWERGPDQTIAPWRDDISFTSLRYLVQTQEFYIVPARSVTQIDLDVEVRRNMDEEADIFLREMQGLSVSGLTVDLSSLPEPVNIGTTVFTER